MPAVGTQRARSDALRRENEGAWLFEFESRSGVPGAMQRSLCCFAEPDRRLPLSKLGHALQRTASRRATRCAALRPGYGHADDNDELRPQHPRPRQRANGGDQGGGERVPGRHDSSVSSVQQAVARMERSAIRVSRCAPPPPSRCCASTACSRAPCGVGAAGAASSGKCTRPQDRLAPKARAHRLNLRQASVAGVERSVIRVSPAGMQPRISLRFIRASASQQTIF